MFFQNPSCERLYASKLLSWQRGALADREAGVVAESALGSTVELYVQNIFISCKPFTHNKKLNKQRNRYTLIQTFLNKQRQKPTTTNRPNPQANRQTDNQPHEHLTSVHESTSARKQAIKQRKKRAPIRTINTHRQKHSPSNKQPTQEINTQQQKTSQPSKQSSKPTNIQAYTKQQRQTDRQTDRQTNKIRNTRKPNK